MPSGKPRAANATEHRAMSPATPKLVLREMTASVYTGGVTRGVLILHRKEKYCLEHCSPVGKGSKHLADGGTGRLEAGEQR